MLLLHKRWLFVVGLILALGVVWLPGQARAEAGGYPYADTPCIWAPYTANGSCPDYDWGFVRDSETADSVLSPYGYYYRNCTDYTAWKVSSLGVGPQWYTGLGNAKQWAEVAARKGLRVDTAPATGSVAVRVAGQYGHTAYVEAVEPGGVLTVSQYNYLGDGRFSVRGGTAASFGFTLFIHFEDLVPVPPQTQSLPAPELPVQEPEPAADEPVIQEESIQAAAAEEVEVGVESAAVLSETAAAATLEPAAIAFPETATVPVEASFAGTTASEENVQPEPTVAAVVAPTVVASEHRPTSPATAVRPVWRQADSSPPLATVMVSPVQTATAAPKPGEMALTYWSVVGLAGTILIREASVRRLAYRARLAYSS